MGYSEFTLRTKDGLELFGREWTVVEPRGVILLIHGLGEHCGRYGTFAANFNTANFTVLGFDQRGHGKSRGQRGHVPNYNCLMEDIEKQKQVAEERFPNTPVFLYGHSLGGNLAINFVLRKKPVFSGVIITSPWLKLAFTPPSYQLIAVRLLNKFWPTLSQGNGLDPATLTKLEEINTKYSQDPLVHNKISIRLFLSSYEAGEWALENASSFNSPLLIMHGTADKITSADASKAFAGQVKNSYTKLWDGLYHEIHNEQEGANVISFVCDWINLIVDK